MLKTLWPKYLLFKNKIEAINIEQIDFENINNAKAEFTTPPVLEKKENNRLNDLVYKNEKENIPMNDFEFIFKDDFLYALISKCKNLFN